MWEIAMRKGATACVLVRFSIPPLFRALGAVDSFPGMGRPGQDETCEDCGSPLDDRGIYCCFSEGGFVEGGSPAGSATLEKTELSKALKRSVGVRGRVQGELAEEALVEACSNDVPPYVYELAVRKYNLKPSKVSSLVVLPEIEAVAQ